MHCCFYCLSHSVTITLFYIWWIFITRSIITHCIFSITWWSLISLFELINNTDHNIIIFWFHNFDFESELLVVGHNLVENKLSKIWIKLCNVLYCAVGVRTIYLKFIWIFLWKFGDVWNVLFGPTKDWK